MSNITEIEENSIVESFSSLMGINGDIYIKEILSTGKLSRSSYEDICNNISYNSEDSIKKYFGLVHWYYLKGYLGEEEDYDKEYEEEDFDDDLDNIGEYPLPSGLPRDNY